MRRDRDVCHKGRNRECIPDTDRTERADDAVLEQPGGSTRQMIGGPSSVSMAPRSTASFSRLTSSLKSAVLARMQGRRILSGRGAQCHREQVQTSRKEDLHEEQSRSYGAGCPARVSAEHSAIGALDRARFEVEVVHLGTARGRLAEVEILGITSVPALALDGQVSHINFGASLSDLK